MQVTLFKALKSPNLSDDQATAVVDGLGQHVENVVNNHIEAVEGKLTGLQASIDAIRNQLNFVGVMIGIVGLAIAAAPIIAKLIH